MGTKYFRRNCWAAVEGSEPEIETTAGLIGADRMCIAAQILMSGALLYGFTEEDFAKAGTAAARRNGDG
jgi:hypothetical protein